MQPKGCMSRRERADREARITPSARAEPALERYAHRGARRARERGGAMLGRERQVARPAMQVRARADARLARTTRCSRPTTPAGCAARATASPPDIAKAQRRLAELAQSLSRLEVSTADHMCGPASHDGGARCSSSDPRRRLAGLLHVDACDHPAPSSARRALRRSSWIRWLCATRNSHAGGSSGTLDLGQASTAAASAWNCQMHLHGAYKRRLSGGALPLSRPLARTGLER